jgi:carboxymethylenebutenolidase
MGDWHTIEVNGAEMRCYIEKPEGDPPWSAVVVIQHAGGVDNFVQDMADRIGLAGFVAIAPDLYHRDDPGTSDDALTRMARLRDDTIAQDVNATIEYLSSLDEVRSDAIGITGFCMGGRVAYMMAARNPDLEAAVVFYGGNIMTAWGDGPPPFDQTANVACPVLGLFGADDQNPSTADVQKIEAAMQRFGKTHEFYSYPNAGHAFMNEDRPSYREDAAADAWAKCIAWFERYLELE